MKPQRGDLFIAAPQTKPPFLFFSGAARINQIVSVRAACHKSHESHNSQRQAPIAGYGRRMTWKQKASARQWAGIIHQHHQRFRFERICMDPNGGGTLIKRELISTRQLINGVDTDVTPI